MDPSGVGGGAPDGNLVVPLDGAQSLPDANFKQGSQPAEDFNSIPTLEGSGPVLGLPPAEQGGQYTVPLPTALPPRETSQTMDARSEAESLSTASLPALRWVQIGLGVVALLFAAAAFWAWRRSR